MAETASDGHTRGARHERAGSDRVEDTGDRRRAPHLPRRARLTDRIELRIGDGVEGLRGLPREPHVDLAFVDAHKPDYIAYHEELVPRLNARGVILVDNVLWSGRVVAEDDHDTNLVAIRAFNDHVAADDRVEAVMLPVGDGLTLVARTATPDPNVVACCRPAHERREGAVDRDEALAGVRRLALALPEATERESHGSPAFFVRRRPQFAAFVTGDHATRGGSHGLWCAAPGGIQEEMVHDDPHRFFVPPYVGGRGWLGLRLDVRPDLDEVAAILLEAYLTVAPATLARQLRP